jgi:flagellar assembly protein FliH
MSLSKFQRLDAAKPAIFVNPDMTPKIFRMPRFSKGQADPELKAYEFTSLDPKASEESVKIAKTLAEAEAVVRDMIARAEAEAQNMKDEAARLKAEAEALRAKAFEEGRQAGHQQGMAQGQAQGLAAFQKDVAPLLASFKKVDQLYNDIWTAHEPLLVRLAVQTAQRIVLKELETPQEVVAAAFRASIEHLQGRHRAVFRVHPQDQAHLESLQGEARERLSGLTQLSFESDPHLARGDLTLETEAGRLDATLKHRLEAVTKAVDEALTERFDLDW